jgi:hypothetical protein
VQGGSNVPQSTKPDPSVNKTDEAGESPKRRHNSTASASSPGAPSSSASGDAASSLNANGSQSNEPDWIIVQICLLIVFQNSDRH